MASDDEFDIDTLRLDHESGTEWKLRKQFLEAHYDKFPMNRLICLSNCFINVELYGCSYPGPLMVQLKSLIEEVDGVEDHRQHVKERNEVKFVKASDGAGSSGSKQSKWDKNKGITGISFVKPTGKFDSEDKPIPSKPPDGENLLNKPVASTSAGPSKQKQTGSNHKVKNVTDPTSFGSSDQGNNELDTKFYQLGSHLRDLLQHSRATPDSLQLVTTAAQKAQMLLSTSFFSQAGEFRCEISIDNVFISSDTGSNKKSAKRAAFEVAFAALRKPFIKVVELNPTRRELHTSDFPMSGEPVESYTAVSPIRKNFQLGVTKLGSATKDNIHSLARGVARKRPASKRSKSLETFLLVEPLHLHHCSNALTILNHSAGFNKVPVTYDFRAVKEGTQTLLEIGGEVVSSSIESGKAGKLAAAESAVEDLRQTNWTLLIKKRADNDHDIGISKEEVLGEDKLNTAIPDSNVGNKLLKMMGWTGGGVGKEGRKGIAEPVTLEAAINRSGLGLTSSQGIGRDFKPKIKTILEDYLRSGDQDDIAFAPDFLKEERAIIHQMAKVLGLKSRSYDKANARFLVISRKRDNVQLIQHLLAQGGETNKYRLIPPGEYEQVRAEINVNEDD